MPAAALVFTLLAQDVMRGSAGALRKGLHSDKVAGRCEEHTYAFQERCACHPMIRLST